jgi:hypothetical protein
MSDQHKQMWGGAKCHGGFGAGNTAFIAGTGHPRCATLTATAAGDYNLTLTEGIDETECEIHCQVRGALAGSDLHHFGVVHTSDTVKRIYVLAEAAVGGASTLVDRDFDVMIERIIPGVG